MTGSHLAYLRLKLAGVNGHKTIRSKPLDPVHVFGQRVSVPGLKRLAGYESLQQYLRLPFRHGVTLFFFGLTSFNGFGHQLRCDLGIMVQYGFFGGVFAGPCCKCQDMHSIKAITARHLIN